MKKAISLIMAILMVISLIPTAFAAWGCVNCSQLTSGVATCERCGEDRACEVCGYCNACGLTQPTNDYKQGTLVEFTATGQESYSVTVPAYLAPGNSGNVTLSGTWPSNRMVTVTTSNQIEMVSSIDTKDNKMLDVYFDGIAKAGSDTEIITEAKPISVENVSNALFGTWSGIIRYNVNVVDYDNAEASSVYYNQPYNATSSTSTYNTRAGGNEQVKTIVVYDDHTVELFIDGVLQTTYPAGSAVIEEKAMFVGDDFEATLSDDFTTITIGDEVFEVNTNVSPIADGRMFIGYTEDMPGEPMVMGVKFLPNNKIDVYINGYLFGEASTQYYMIGNMIFLQDPNENPTVYGYVSFDGTQIVQKGECILSAQNNGALYYGQAYSTYGSFTGNTNQERLSVIPYNDGSFDLIVDRNLVAHEPSNSFSINGDTLTLTSQALGTATLAIKDGGRTMEIVDNGVASGYGLVLDSTYSDLARGKTYTFIVQGQENGTVVFDESYGWTIGAGQSGLVIRADHAIILSGLGLVLRYDESDGAFHGEIRADGETVTVDLIPVQ